MAQSAEKTRPAAAPDEKTDESTAALDSFLSREPNGVKKPADPSGRKPNRNLIMILAAAGAVVLLVGIIIFLNHNPKPAEEDDAYAEAWTIATVDEAGMHQVEVPTDGEGAPHRNGSGVLIDYAPSLITSIRVDNASGSFLIRAHTDPGQATEYVMDGFEDFPLQTGMPDNVANDAGDLHFLTIASTVRDPADFGLAAPRARVYVTYTDGTSAVINVGDEAAGSAGVYISFGDARDVYLVSADAVDSFFYSPTEFISRTITETPESADSASFSRITLTGSRCPQPITLEPNTDPAVNYFYRMTSPIVGFADAVMGADVAGSIRDLYAEEVVAVNANGMDTASFLSSYGLGDDCYAEVIADYPDTTIRLRASAPDGDGSVLLANLSDAAGGGRIVYRIQIGAVSWASASVEKLTPETILSVSRTGLSNITLTAGGRSISIDVDTRTQTVETTDGGTEQVTTTEAYYNDRLLSDEVFTILLQNLIGMKNAGSADAPRGDMLLEIRYTYTTGRATDTLVIYQSTGKNCAVELNGTAVGSVAKTYAEALVTDMNDVIAGRTPKSL